MDSSWRETERSCFSPPLSRRYASTVEPGGMVEGSGVRDSVAKIF